MGSRDVPPVLAAHNDNVLQLVRRLSKSRRGRRQDAHADCLLSAARDPRIDDLLCARLRELETQQATSHSACTKRMASLERDMSTLRAQLAHGRAAHDRWLQQQRLHTDAIERRLRDAVKEELRSQQRAERDMIAAFEQETTSLRVAVTHERGLCQKAEENFERFRRGCLPEICARIREAAETREQVERDVLRKFTGEIEDLEDAVFAEVQAREASEAALLRVCDEAAKTMAEELSRARRDREASENALLELIEAAYERLRRVAPAAAILSPASPKAFWGPPSPLATAVQCTDAA